MHLRVTSMMCLKSGAKMNDFLYPHQRNAINKMSNGCILNGGVGSGKSRTGLYYYFQKNGGSFENKNYRRMTTIQPLYIITTAKKRDSKEWNDELANYRISVDKKLSLYPKLDVYIDSWNNIQKYKTVRNAFFIFDEDRITGKGKWVDAFLKIAKYNDWIILSATPGDTWEQYVPVFVANGFFKNRTEFYDNHVVWSKFTNFPQIAKYYNTDRLVRLRDSILVDMDFKRLTKRHSIDIPCEYDKTKYRTAQKDRWNIYKDEPIQQASELCSVLRRIVNEDESRVTALLELMDHIPRAIIFYNFDYERDILLHVFSDMGQCVDNYEDIYEVAEWSGHAHQPVPNSKKWVYLVQYTAGCEGWNCIDTDTIIFYSQNYSYKVVEQAMGRIDRLNTTFVDLYFYTLKSKAPIDLAISQALSKKKKFNENRWVNRMY